jgi:pilus assembly protein Flp/PilA
MTVYTQPATREGRSMKHVMRFLRDEEGATAVEYGIMVAAIAAVIIGAVILVGDRTKDAFDTVEGEMSSLPGT